MDPLQTLSIAISQIREPRLFSTERGYQGQLVTELDKLMEGEPGSIARPIVEQEYQKRAKLHGLKLRPDIIVHIPFDRGVSPTRRDDNHLVILLKLAAKKKKAEQDFKKLEMICSVLDYPVGAFVNITSSALWLPHYNRQSDKNFILYEIAVTLHDMEPKLLMSRQ